MSQSPSASEIPYSAVLDALLDPEIEITQQHLFRLSDLEGKLAREFKKCWPKIALWRRLALLEDMEQLAEENNLLSYEFPCRLSIHDADPQIRFLAIRGLLPYEPIDLLPELTTLLRQDADENVRAICAATLGQFVYLGEIEDISKEQKKNTVDSLLEASYNDPSVQVRQRALESLGYTSQDEIVALIEEAYQTGEVSWITSALFAMGRSCNSHWVPKISPMLDHQIPAIRFEAARAAGELQIKDTIDRLTELVEDTNTDVRLAAAWSLSQIGG